MILSTLAALTLGTGGQGQLDPETRAWQGRAGLSVVYLMLDHRQFPGLYTFSACGSCRRCRTSPKFQGEARTDSRSIVSAQLNVLDWSVLVPKQHHFCVSGG